MTPFQSFRLWLRRASVADRLTTLMGATLALALLGWSFVPTSVGDKGFNALAGAPAGTSTTSPGEQQSAGTGAPPGSAVDASPSAPLGVGPSGKPVPLTALPGGGPVLPTAGPVVSSGGGCTPPPGSDQGVTTKAVSVAIVVVSIAGSSGNATFGLPSPQEQKQSFDVILADLNKTGGVFCRKVVARYFEVNPEDANGQQQACLDIVAAKPFAVLDSGGYFQSPSASCYPQNKLPFFTTTALVRAQVDQFYPYMFSFLNVEVIYRNMVFGLRQRGFFSAANGFVKFGYLYRDCFPELKAAFEGWLKQAGVSASQTDSFNLGCTSDEVSPAALQQAILQFKQRGVTHVSAIQGSQDLLTFTRLAQQQGFTPKYGLVDDGIIALTPGNLHPDYDNIADALVIAPTRYGEDNSRVPRSAGTKRCDAIFAAHGRPSVYRQQAGLAGNACSLVWMFAAATTGASSMQRGALAAGLRAARSIEMSYPQGPVDWSGPRVTYGGQYWRAEQFYRSCSCWKLLESAFHPSFR